MCGERGPRPAKSSILLEDRALGEAAHLVLVIRGGFPEEEEATRTKMIQLGVSQVKKAESKRKHERKGPEVRGACVDGREERERRREGMRRGGKRLN